MRYEDERVALFIDGSNLAATLRLLRLSIDYQKLLETFSPKASYYYVSLNPHHDDSAKRLMLNHLERLGFTVVTRKAKAINSNGILSFKGNMDIEIAVDMILEAEKYDRVILFSGDSDFSYAVRKIQEKGIRVTVISSTRTAPPSASPELRRQADVFLDLDEMRVDIEKPKVDNSNDMRPDP